MTLEDLKLCWTSSWGQEGLYGKGHLELYFPLEYLGKWHELTTQILQQSVTANSFIQYFQLEFQSGGLVSKLSFLEGRSFLME